MQLLRRLLHESLAPRDVLGHTHEYPGLVRDDWGPQWKHRASARDVRPIDVGSCLAQSAARLRPPGMEVQLDLQIAIPHSRVRVDPAGLICALRDLAALARTAQARRLVIRNRKIGARIWIIIGDDGDVIPQFGTEWRDALDDPRSRVARFVSENHGELLVRQSPRHGSLFVVILPCILSLASITPTGMTIGPLA